MFPTTFCDCDEQRFDLVRQLQVLVNDGGLLVRSKTFLSLGNGASASGCLIVDPPPAPVVEADWSGLATQCGSRSRML